jgi:drug/metabolite transporter, DME family
LPRYSPLGALLVLTGVTCWGVGSLLVPLMLDQGLTPAQVSFYGNGLSAIVLFAGLLVFAPRYLRVPYKSLPLLLSVGAVGPGFAGLCYTTAIAETSLSLATVLLYTSPAWVTLLAWRFLGEPIGARKAAAVGAAVVGVALVAQAYDPAALSGSMVGILLGIAGGFGYACFIVLSKKALRRHHPLTVTAYVYPSAALLMLPLQQTFLPMAFSAQAWLLLGLYVVGSQILGNVAYNGGLSRTPAGLVSILALWSPITTLGLGALVLGESLAPLQMVGALLVIGSVAAMRPAATPKDSSQPELAPSTAAARAG